MMFGSWKPPKKLPPINNHVPPFRNPTAPAPAAEPVKYERIRRAKDELAAALTALGEECYIEVSPTENTRIDDQEKRFRYTLRIKFIEWI